MNEYDDEISKAIWLGKTVNDTPAQERNIALFLPVLPFHKCASRLLYINFIQRNSGEPFVRFRDSEPFLRFREVRDGGTIVDIIIPYQTLITAKMVIE